MALLSKSNSNQIVNQTNHDSKQIKDMNIP